MELPKSVKIGGIRYDVTIDKTLHDTGFNGQIRMNRCQIVVAGEMHPVAALQTLWHEIIHGILSHAGVAIADHSEAQIEMISYGLVQVLSENHELGEMTMAKKGMNPFAKGGKKEVKKCPDCGKAMPCKCKGKGGKKGY